MISGNAALGTGKAKQLRDPRKWLTVLAYAFLLQWYFRPMCLQYLRSYGSFGKLPSLLFNAYAYVALAISVFVLLLWGIRKIEFRDSFLILYFLWITLSSLINNGFHEFASAGASLITQLGLACLLFHLLKERPKTIAWALLIIFAVHFILNAMTVIVRPWEFRTIKTEETIIYFFGGKNSIFMWGILLPATMLFMLTEAEKRHWIKLAIVFSVMYAALAIYVDSASSSVCFIATALLLFLEYRGILPKPLFTAPNYLIFTIFIFFFIIVFNSVSVFADFLSMLNRSTSFSGRDVLWAQGIDYVVASPLFGCGSNIPFYLGSINAGHAHSFYLTYAARYGIPASVFFLLDAWMVCNKVKKANNRHANLLVIPYCALLFHSLFDVLTIGSLILLRTLIAYEIDFYEEKKPEPPRYRSVSRYL